MKKRIFCLFLAIVMTVTMLSVFASCGDDCEHAYDNDCDTTCNSCGETREVGEHVDADKNQKCDKCGAKVKGSGTSGGGGSEEEIIDYPWDSQTLIFQMTNNTNRDELPSACERYLAGESTDTDEIDEMVAERNAECKYFTGITVTYLYYPNTDAYKWSANIERIETTVKSGATKDVPDMYCNFVYDMVGASLKSCFANLYSTSRGKGDLAGLNYFSFIADGYSDEVNEGYMYEYMTTTTLSMHKMYILASDYFTDMIRAFFCIPVSVKHIEATGAKVTGNSSYNLDDFYDVVRAGDWTYDTLAEYAKTAHVDDGSSDTAGQWLGDEVVGFAMSSGGLAVSGLIYTTSVVIIHRKWDDTTNDWTYFYPDYADSDLGAFCLATSDLMVQPGIVYVRSSNTPGMTEWGQTELLAIRTRFTQGHVLFGDIMLVGALEFQQYQEMKDDGGFGVVPVPLYRKYDREGEQERYLTQIHNMGRPGAIAANTLKFVECTAFLQYQSTHSTDILNEYYDYKLQYDVVDGAQTGTVEMLRYIRSNVRTTFDKTFEDAIGRFYGTEDSKSWASIISSKSFILDIRGDYRSIVDAKNVHLKNLEKYYTELPW